MALNIKLDLSLQQKLVLTPALQQAIKLLQLNRVELLQEIHQELLQNPTLEEVVSDADENSTDEEEILPEEEETPGNPNPLKEVEWERYFDYEDAGEKYYRGYDSSEFVFADNFVNKKSSLSEHLLWQVGLTHLSDEDKAIAERIIEYINEDGYIWVDDEDIARDIGISVEKTRDIIEVIQEFDPVGVGARNLRECLLNQIITLRREFIRSYSSMGIVKEDIDNAERIIEGYLDFLETKKYEELGKILNLSEQEIEKAVKVISGLEPKPGRQFNPDSILYIVPDVYVIEDNGEFIVLLNDDGIPRLRLSEFYTNVARQKISVGKEAKKFVEQKINSAVWFIKSIEQRKQTILNVAKQIVRFQREFFEIGIEGLKPLTLQNIAQELDIHESTVSRVVHNKYMHTPQGIFEMKYFFHGGLKTNNGENISSIVIKNTIKNLILSENRDKPLNDRQIADSLREKGIEIARRTVAKYRESLNILSSSQRKKEYKRTKILRRRDE